jgi:hypothetical protein
MMTWTGGSVSSQFTTTTIEMAIAVSKGASLDRYYLFKFKGFGVFLHRIHASDPVGLFHSHPWNGVSIIFGAYTEFFQDSSRPFLRKWLNFIKAKRHHRVEVRTPVWTLFIHLPKSNKWSIVDRTGTLKSEAPWEGDQGYKDYSKAAA